MYKTEFTRESKKNLSSIPKEYQIAVINSLKGLSNDPLKGKPLGGKFKGQYSLRVGVYRVVYIINQGLAQHGVEYPLSKGGSKDQMVLQIKACVRH